MGEGVLSREKRTRHPEKMMQGRAGRYGGAGVLTEAQSLKTGVKVCLCHSFMQHTLREGERNSHVLSITTKSSCEGLCDLMQCSQSVGLRRLDAFHSAQESFPECGWMFSAWTPEPEHWDPVPLVHFSAVRQGS